MVDECHRSIYGKWRSVLEYFDAPIVGLTATPVAQTFGYFNGNLVSEYTYQEAVADGVNVDFSVYEIETRITAEGGVIAQGTIPVRDRRTRRQRYEDIDEDIERLIAHMWELAEWEGRPVSNQGTARWLTPEGETLVDLAWQLLKNLADGEDEE